MRAHNATSSEGVGGRSAGTFFYAALLLVLIACGSLPNMNTKTISALLWGAAFSVLAGQTEFHVAVSGNDDNPGTKKNPVATLQAARDLVRAVGDKTKDITIWVGSGAYDMTAPFVLNEKDSAAAGKTITWRAQGEVRLVGGRTLPADAFKPLTDKTVLKRLSAAASGKIYVADLSKLGISDYGTHKQFGHALSVCPAPLELFFNDAAMTLARYPNKGDIRLGKIIDKGSIPRNGDYSQRGGIFQYNDERHAVWAGQKDVWLQGTFGNGYADDKILIESIDPETKQIKLAMPHMYGLKSGRSYLKYVALNILDELDMPGEWYLDRDCGKLYFWPPATLEVASIRISVLEDPIVCLEGVSNVLFRDFIVEQGRGIGIYIERGNNNLVAGCTVRNMGTSGIFMGQGAQQTVPYITHDDYDGVPISRRVGNVQGHIYRYTTWNRKAGTNHKILSCDVYSTGCGGIVLSGGDKKTLTPGNNTVENCKIHDYNGRNKFLWSGVNIDGVANRIAHCEIYNSDFQAMYCHGNEHVYEYNNVHHVTQDADDVSPWYLGRDPSDRGNVIRYNYFHHIGNPKKMNMGIYCDDSTTDVRVHGNVFYKMNTRKGIIYSNGGWDLLMDNNIIIEPCGPVAVLSPQYYTWAKKHVQTTFGPDGLFETRLQNDLDITKPPYSERYPELVNYMEPIVPGKEWEGMRSRRNMLRNNVVVKGHQLVSKGKVHSCFETEGNFQTDEDPGFVDMKNGNFSLKKDAIVFEKIPGFEAPPFSEMGLYTDEFRKTL